MRGTLIVPLFNAEPFLQNTLREIHAWMGRRTEPWELILVDDASRDATPSIVEQFVAAHPGDRIRFVRFDANHGKGFAVRVGLDQAAGSIAVFTDCDLAYPLRNVDRIVERLEDGADAAIACRVLPESTYTLSPGFFSYLFTRHLMGRGFNALSRLLVTPGILDTQAGLKGFRTAAVRPLLPRLRLDGFSFDVELLRGLIDRGARIDEVPVDFRYDSEPSTVHFAMDAARMARDLVRVRWRSLRGVYAGSAESPRAVIVHADDYGLAPGINRAIEEGLEAGGIHSASILVSAASAGRALAWAASHPEFDFGVHLNLTQGRPVLDRARVPTLVDRDGRFHRLGPFLARLGTGRIRVSEIEAEWRAQIAVARSAGVRISHLDSHQHVHLIPAIFRNAAVGLAVDEGLSLRAMNGPSASGRLPDLKGLALGLATRISLGRRFRHLAPARGAGIPLRDRATLDVLRASLERARPGETIELVCHPGFTDDVLVASGDSYREGREEERALLASAETRSWMRLSGFRPTSFRV